MRTELSLLLYIQGNDAQLRDVGARHDDAVRLDGESTYLLTATALFNLTAALLHWYCNNSQTIKAIAVCYLSAKDIALEKALLLLSIDPDGRDCQASVVGFGWLLAFEGHACNLSPRESQSDKKSPAFALLR